MVETFMYVGSCNRALPYFASAHGEGIAAFRFDAQSGVATPIGTVKGVDNPTFVAVDPLGQTLNATSEVLDWNEGTVTAYAIDAQTGALSYINKQATRGDIAAQISFDRTGRFLFVANYGAGPVTQRPNRSLAVFPRRADGELGAAAAEATHAGQGVDPARQDRPHAHSVLATPDNRFLVVADLGLDRLVVYSFDASEGRIEPHGETALPPGSGPRHFVFHPSQPRAYVVNELNSTVASLAFHAAEGRFEALSTCATVPEAARANNHGSEIRISANGRHLFVGNRGHDSIARFAIDEATGVAALVETTPSGGKTPRHFAFDPSEKFLAVANQDSDCVAFFAFDAETGSLRPLPRTLSAGTPTCIAFAAIS